MIQDGRSSNVPVNVLLSCQNYVIPAVCLSRMKVCPGTVRSRVHVWEQPNGWKHTSFNRL